MTCGSARLNIEALADRYGLVTVTAVMLLLDKGYKATCKLVERMQRQGRLFAHRIGRFTYYTRHPKSELRGVQDAINKLARLMFAATCGVECLTSNEFRTHFPQLCVPGFPTGAWATFDKAIIFVVIDHGGTANRIAKKIRKLYDRLLAEPVFKVLLVAPNFEPHLTIKVLTPFTSKADAITNSLNKIGLGTLEIVVVEEYGALLLRPKDKDKKKNDKNAESE